MEAETTRGFLLRALLQGPQTAQALAEEAEVNVAAARRYLDAFVAAGLAKEFFRQEGMGRPKKYYEITAEGRESLPRRYDLLLGSLTQAAVKHHGAHGLAALMRTVSEGLAKEHGARIPAHLPLKERVKALARVLRELGFPTEIEERDGKFMIVRRDCIFLQAARAHPEEVCNHLDTAFLSQVLDVPVDLVQCIPFGDGVCRHEIRERRATASS